MNEVGNAGDAGGAGGRGDAPGGGAAAGGDEPDTREAPGNTLGHYMQVHLAGAAAGIDLFTLSGRRIIDPETRTVVRRIRDELKDERTRLVRMAEAAGTGDSRLASLLTRVGAQAVRLGPQGNWMRRNALTDLVVLETMRDAVAGKIAGWQALLTVVDQHDGLDREELEQLLAQGERQHDDLTRAHALAAGRALGPSTESEPES